MAGTSSCGNSSRVQYLLMTGSISFSMKALTRCSRSRPAESSSSSRE